MHRPAFPMPAPYPAYHGDACLSRAICLHLTLISGRDPHHIVECQFKALARALRDAMEFDPRMVGIPSTKGAL